MPAAATGAAIAYWHSFRNDLLKAGSLGFHN